MSAQVKSHDFGMPWEKGYGFCQAMQVGSTLYISGQLSHDMEARFVQQLVEIAAIAEVAPPASRKASRSRAQGKSR